MRSQQDFTCEPLIVQALYTSPNQWPGSSAPGARKSKLLLPSYDPLDMDSR